MRWVEMPSNDLTFPILSDPQWGVSNRFERDFGIPTYSLIGRDMEILVVDGSVTPAKIEEALEAEVPEVDWNVPPDLDDTDDWEATDTSGSQDETNDGIPAAEQQAGVGPFGGGPAPPSRDGFTAPYGGCTASIAPLPASGKTTGLWLALAALLGFRRRRRPAH